MLPTISDTALELLNQAALQIQAELMDRTGERYELVDLNDVLIRWLESSIEALCESACEFCVTGDRTYASFNRHHFERLLKKSPSTNIWEQSTEVAQPPENPLASVLNRVA